jgi:hypothetical protein
MSPDVNHCAVEAAEQRQNDTQVFPVEDGFVGILLQEGCRHMNIRCSNADEGDDNQFRYLTWTRKQGEIDYDTTPIAEHIIMHQVKTNELMLQIHTASCCRAGLELVDQTSCSNLECSQGRTRRKNKRMKTQQTESTTT